MIYSHSNLVLLLRLNRLKLLLQYYYCFLRVNDSLIAWLYSKAINLKLSTHSRYSKELNSFLELYSNSVESFAFQLE